MKYFFRLFIMMVCVPVMIEARALDMKQILILKTVKNIALQYPNTKGETFEDTLMAICLAETSAGKVDYGDKQLLKKGIKQASYGIMQVRLETARFVGKSFNLPEVKLLSDTELIKKLMHENLFTVKIAALYLNWLSVHSENYFEMVSRYNGGRINHPYFNKIQKNLNFLKRYKL